MALLEIKNLSFYFENNKAVLKDINLSLEAGEFAVITGPTGSGKSTLLSLVKKEPAPKGKLTGEIIFSGKARADLSLFFVASEIGFVMQKPENQIVTDKVYHELAFGLENLGLKREEIERRIGETVSFFGIDSWFRKDTFTLSGGEKQILALASIMAMRPRLLLLDEPTSELDPIAAEQFLSILEKINKELGVTVLIVEHRLDYVLSLADKLVVLDKGKIIASGAPRDVVLALENFEDFALPSATKIFRGLKGAGACPLTVKEGALFLSQYKQQIDQPLRKEDKNGKKIIQISDLWFAYQKTEEVFRGLDLDVYEGEILALVGGNGSGKSTLLKLLAGFYKPLLGKILLWGRNLKSYRQELYEEILAYLPQNPQDLFLETTVAFEIIQTKKLKDLFALEELLALHPYDLSGGEQQRLALSKVLFKEAEVFLLDEPTKGLDPKWKRKLRGILHELKSEGKTIIMVTHDLDFAAKVSDRAGLIFDGRLVSLSTAIAFFSGNTFYTTPANRIARNLYPEALTAEEVIALAEKHGKIIQNS